MNRYGNCKKGKNIVYTQKILKHRQNHMWNFTAFKFRRQNIVYYSLVVDSGGGRLLFCWNGVGACLFLASFLRAYCINLFHNFSLRLLLCSLLLSYIWAFMCDTTTAMSLIYSSYLFLLFHQLIYNTNIWQKDWNLLFLSHYCLSNLFTKSFFFFLTKSHALFAKFFVLSSLVISPKNSY